MNPFQKRALALLICLALAVSLAVPSMAAERQPASADRQKSAETAVGYAMQYGEALSASWALWEDGVLTISQQTQNLPASLKDAGHLEQLGLLGGDLYGIGSVSKMYTATAVMKLAEAGKLSLDRPVTDYLKDFKMADSRYRDITVRMLLNHTSGLMGTSQRNAMLFADDDQQAADQLLKRLETQSLRAEPGAFCSYCNDGFTLAQLIVEAVSGKEFLDYLRQDLLPAAGGAEIYAPADGESAANRLAVICSAGEEQRVLPHECLGILGAGGLYATAEDLAAYGGALTGTKLLSAASAAAMAQPEYARGIWPEGEPAGFTSFGLGWDAVEFWPFSQSGIQCLVKGGDTLYYHAALLVLPEYHMAAAVLTSGGVSAYNEMAAARMLVDALSEKGVEVDESAPALPEAAPAPMPAALTEESGCYGSSVQQLRVTVDAGGTMTIHQMLMADVPDQTLSYYSDGSFRNEYNTARVKLVKEENGCTYFYQNSYTPLPGLGVMPVSDYLLVKMPENPVDRRTQDIWDALMAKEYLPLGEKYSSALYQALADAMLEETAAESTAESFPGYTGTLRILDEERAVYDLPVGRDGQSVTVTPYGVDISGAPYGLEENIPALYTGSGWSYATVQEDGFARWFRTGSAAGRTMTVTMPENCGWWVYDSRMQVAASSVLDGNISVVLPEDGLVVFAGEPGTRFHLHFTL